MTGERKMETSDIQQQGAEQSSPQISLREFFMVIFVHKWTIVIAFIIMLAAILMGLSLRERLFVASVKFFVNRDLPQQTALRFSGRLEWEEEINSIAEMGRSQGVLVQTARLYDALRGWPDPPESRINEIAAGLATMVEVVPVQETDIINVLVRDADADTSVIIADLYGQAFLYEFRRITQESHGRDFFEAALADVEEKILTAKESKAKLQEDVKLYNWSFEQNVITETVQYFMRELTRERMNRQLFQRHVEMEEAFFEDPDNFTLTPSLLADKLINKLEFVKADLQLALMELSSLYTEDHRLVQAKAAELESAKSQQRELISKAINENRQKLAQMLHSERVFQESIDEYNRRLEHIPGNAVRIEFFNAYISAQWQLYGELITKYTDTRATEEQGVLENQIVQLGPPNIGGIEGETPRVVRVIVAPLFALILALALAFMKEATTHTFQKPIELEEYTGLPVLASFRKL